jgi:hypothetical protein
MQDNMADDVNQLYVGNINWWMIWRLMMWIAYMSRELH